MKILIMAAGIGRGLRPITELIPKPLIPIANKPLIEHLISNFQKLGFSEFIVLVGYLKEKIEVFLKKITNQSIDIQIISAKNYEKGPLYTFNAAKSLKLEEDFILCPADLFIDPKLISNIIEYHKKGTLSIAIDSSRPSSKGTEVFTYSESHSNFKNNFYNYGKVAGFKERILNKSGSSGLAIPLSICPTSLFEYIDELLEENETKVISLFNQYIKKLNPAHFIDLSYYSWFDVDSLDEILKVNNFALLNRLKPKNHILLTKHGSVKDFKLSQLKNFHSKTKIIPPILIGENCFADKNSQIGPNVSLDNNSELEEKVEIKNSIVSGNSRVPINSNINNAIIYKNRLINVSLN